MSEYWICPQGHRWERDSQATSLTGGGLVVCPVCAAAGTRAGSADEPVGMAEEDPFATILPDRNAPPPRPFAFVELPGYEVLGELGRGGMGVVFKARHQALQRMVAVKMLLGGAFAGPQHVARFFAEAEAVARLQHPNIVQIYEIGEADREPYFAMEYVDGRSLSQQLAGRPMPPVEAARTLELLARAVAYAHQHGIIHRDLKPANVLVSREGHVKVTDFGLAKHLDGRSQGAPTVSGHVLGTPEYMAPEQAEDSSKAGVASDVYALGVILYEALTGCRPFEGETPVQTLRRVAAAEPLAPRRLRPGVPRDLETICLKCLQKEPHRRYAGAGLLADDLLRWLAGEPIHARPVRGLERAWKWARRRPALAAALATTALSLVVVTAVSLGAAVRLEERWQALQAEQLRTAAAQEEQKLALAQTLLTATPDRVPAVLEALAPSARLVLPLLRQRFESADEEPGLRLRAAVALTALGDTRIDFLLDAVPAAPQAEGRNLALAFKAARDDDLIARLRRRAHDARDVHDRVRYAVLLLDLGDAEVTRELLVPVTDPTPRTQLIDAFPGWHGDLAALPDLLAGTDDAECRSGLCAAVGRLDPATLATPVRQRLTEVLKGLYREAPDGGTHGAAGWALRQWGQTLPVLEPSAGPTPGRQWFVNQTGLTMVAVPPGQDFLGNWSVAVLTRPYFMSDREVSVAQFRRFCADAKAGAAWRGPAPGSTGPSPDCPVNNVSRQEMIEFCNWLSTAEGRRPCYRRTGPGPNDWQCDFRGDGYRLPTEAEWSHAQRAGSRTRFFFGDDPKWLLAYAHVSALRTAPGGSKLPNRWGLFDLAGNVWEMCWDGDGPLARGVAFDPVASPSGSRYVWRGGAYDSGSYDTWSGFRHSSGAGPWESLGFRVVCTAGGPAPSAAQAGDDTQRQLDACGRALVDNPDNVALRQVRANLLTRLARWPEAAANLSRAAEALAWLHRSQAPPEPEPSNDTQALGLCFEICWACPDPAGGSHALRSTSGRATLPGTRPKNGKLR